MDFVVMKVSMVVIPKRERVDERKKQKLKK